MTFLLSCRGLLAAAVIFCAPLPALAQNEQNEKPVAADPAATTAGDVRAEVTQAMEAIASYSGQERDQALAEARKALDSIDAEIARREESLRDRWAAMSDGARTEARTRLQELRAARDALGERYGALQAGTADAWQELRAGFSGAWTAFSDAWTAAETEPQGN